MTTCYMAFDGEVFKTEKECEEYENQGYLDHLHMYDMNGLPTNDIDTCHILIVKTQEEVDMLERIFDSCELPLALVPGETYVWLGGWFELSTIQDVIKNAFKILEEGEDK
ncbi:MAG: hypothetical protein NC548_22900 [Lachnospiraceae bacterium]|nr:hypothetical protein [Lachnospiraceae bacterium]